ncbi:MAG: vanadium-dependent haloperoxidase [Anaerolineae bacterium]|nr:vanadium-dependent haloperoxidase [Anaerolineae bacterium]
MMTRIGRAALFALLLLGLSLFVLPTHPAAAQDEVSVLAADHDAAVLVKWMQLLYDRVEAEAISAPAAARLYAYAGITAYQSVLPGIPEGLSLSGQLNGMDVVAYLEDDAEYDWPSSANAALATVVAGLFPEDAQQTQRAVDSLRTSQQRSRERAVDPEVVARSTAYGDEIGQLILEWMSLDYFAETRDMEYEFPTGDPSFWVPTREGMRAVEPFWGQIRPFAMYYPDQCAVTHNMPFSTDPDSTFYAQAMEVKTVGDNLTREQREIAQFWVDTPGETGTPAGHWVLIANQLVDVLELKLDRAAMMYGLLNIALGDAFISAWSLKYQVNLLRPETYIKQYIDERWNPLIASPGFPEYPSGHSVVSGAAAEVLTQMFGQVAFTDRSKRRHGLPERSFTSFEAAASEAAISRIYGGIHFREAIENGLRQGRCVGRHVLNYVLLRSIPQGE